MENSILIQNVTLDQLERMIDRAVERRMKEFCDSIREKAPVLLKRKDAAREMGVSLPTLDSYSRAGILHSKHIGGRVYFEESEILRFKGLG